MRSHDKPRLTARTPVSHALSSDRAREVLAAELPHLIGSPLTPQFEDFPLAGFLLMSFEWDEVAADRVMAVLARIEDPVPPAVVPAEIRPDPGYEGADVPTASAILVLPDDAEQHRPVEVELRGPSHGNPFVDVELGARFTRDGRTVEVGGFYDGDGTYRIRFLPDAPGAWDVVTASTARSLDGITGTIEVAPGTGRGPVRAADGFHFATEDGAVFRPVGTTSYAWLHQSADLKDRTVRALGDAPFTKLRMALFPKHYVYNQGEPDRAVFARDATGAFDVTRFDLEFFADLERRIGQLAAIGVESELILFHPYDRWGLAALGAAVDDRYVRYVVRRLAAFPSVWWAMANEWDLLTAKTVDDWHRLGRLVRAEDHVGHPRSIHNWVEQFDHTTDWITHASVQRSAFELAAEVDGWRRLGKPVVVDEFGYEGDLEQDWGNLPPEEIVRRAWIIALRGAYATHGETYWHDGDVVFWSKGGDLVGEAVTRIAFLQQIADASPTGRFEPLRGLGGVSGGVAEDYAITYHGVHRPRTASIAVPPGRTATIDLIDTWNMTIERIPGVFEGAARIDLPARPYLATLLRCM